MIIRFDNFNERWLSLWLLDLLFKVEDHSKWSVPDPRFKTKWKNANYIQINQDLNKLGYSAWIDNTNSDDPKIMVDIPDREYTFLVLKYSH